MKDADARCRELEFEGRQPHHVRCSRLVVWHCLEMFTKPPGERYDLIIPEPHGWVYEIYRCLAVSTPLMFSCLADHLCSSGLKVRERLGRTTGIEIEVTTLGAFLRTIRYESPVG